MSTSIGIIFFLLFVATVLLIGKYTRFHVPDNDTQLQEED
jgi:hypothetical protein